MGFFFCQAEVGIRGLVRSRGLGDVYKRQAKLRPCRAHTCSARRGEGRRDAECVPESGRRGSACLLYTSDAADERSSVDLGGRRIIKKKKNNTYVGRPG